MYLQISAYLIQMNITTTIMAMKHTPPNMPPIMLPMFVLPPGSSVGASSVIDGDSVVISGDAGGMGVSVVVVVVVGAGVVGKLPSSVKQNAMNDKGKICSNKLLYVGCS